MSTTSSTLPILPFPQPSVQRQIPSEEWQTCLQAWLSASQYYVQLPEFDFVKAEVQRTVANFLQSFLSAVAEDHDREAIESVEGKTLFQVCRKLIVRFLETKEEISSPKADFVLLCRGTRVYLQSQAWRKFLSSAWSSNPTRIQKAIQAGKLEVSRGVCTATTALTDITSLIKALPAAAAVAVAGADHLDTISDLLKDSQDNSATIVEHAFVSFIALLRTKHVTLLTDNIYHLKAEADRLRRANDNHPTLLSFLVCTTTLLRHMGSNPEVHKRNGPLLKQLEEYRQTMSHQHPLRPKPRFGKGKERSDSFSGFQVHTAADVSQIHELFPHLSTTYILRALTHYSNQVESAIAALLEPDSLPLSLQDQNEIVSQDTKSMPPIDLQPRSTPPEYAKPSISDDLDFDNLRLDPKQLRRGKKNISEDQPVDDVEHAKSKAAILSALAAFDSDDDERDDTYDVADVGGAVDNTVDTDERRLPEVDTHEALLYNSWAETPEIFGRDSTTRASAMRQQIKRETGMTDEQIEGWALMLNKDTKTKEKLRNKYTAANTFGGRQQGLASTKWRANASTENSEVESGPERSNDTRRMGQAGIRGHRNFGQGRGRGRGGSTSGPVDDASTQAARRRKEQGRGRGASQRRDARAKKIGRGMGALAPS